MERRHPNIRLLGSGYESVVFTDDSKVYKIFRKDPEYYRHIGEQLAGRFEGCKHLYDVTFEMLEGHTVFTYDYEPSRSYSGGMESELIETMAEFALCGIVCIDVKPNNFRITPSGLKYIDYGHDLRPYNEQDFLAMCLRTFLCIKYWPEPQFIPFAQVTNFTWDRQRTDGFTEFFNTIYRMYTDKKDAAKPSEFRIPSNRWIMRMINDNSSEETVVHCLSDMSDELFFHDVSRIEEVSGDTDIFLISKDSEMKTVLAERIRDALGNGKMVRMVMPNPFFRSGFVRYSKMLESMGLYPVILAHSDPVPCNAGLESKYILLEFKNRPTEESYPQSTRNEDYIFIICGRNVPPECYLRCWHSLEMQRCGRWGAIIVDDASDDADIDLLIKSTACTHKRVTYIRNSTRQTILPNIVNSVRDLCTNPNSVIITLDMDDALLNKDALCMIRTEYLRGHDVVSSTCLKKGVRILPYEIKYDRVRDHKAGDVWMHLRSFRKYLFDRIDESDFKENEEWIEIFNELTFMVPIAEMASDPIQVRAPLYLWEPRTVDDDAHKKADAHTLALVTSRRPYPTFPVPRTVGEIRPPGMLVRDFGEGDVLIIRHAEKENRPDYLSTERGITERGERESEFFGRYLKHIDVYVCSEIRRTSETAYCMNKGNGGDFDIVIDPLLNALRYDYRVWCGLKEKFGYLGVLRKWRNGEFKNGELPNFKEYAIGFLRKLLDLSDGKTVCIVTHDHMICVLSTIFRECADSRVPYMGGFTLKRSEISERLRELQAQ